MSAPSDVCASCATPRVNYDCDDCNKPYCNACFDTHSCAAVPSAAQSDDGEAFDAPLDLDDVPPVPTVPIVPAPAASVPTASAPAPTASAPASTRLGVEPGATAAPTVSAPPTSTPLYSEPVRADAWPACENGRFFGDGVVTASVAATGGAIGPLPALIEESLSVAAVGDSSAAVLSFERIEAARRSQYVRATVQRKGDAGPPTVYEGIHTVRYGGPGQSLGLMIKVVYDDGTSRLVSVAERDVVRLEMLYTGLGAGDNTLGDIVTARLSDGAVSGGWRLSFAASGVAWAAAYDIAVDDADVPAASALLGDCTIALVARVRNTSGVGVRLAGTLVFSQAPSSFAKMRGEPDAAAYMEAPRKTSVYAAMRTMAAPASYSAAGTLSDNDGGAAPEAPRKSAPDAATWEGGTGETLLLANATTYVPLALRVPPRGQIRRVYDYATNASDVVHRLLVEDAPPLPKGVAIASVGATPLGAARMPRFAAGDSAYVDFGSADAFAIERYQDSPSSSTQGVERVSRTRVRVVVTWRAPTAKPLAVEVWHALPPTQFVGLEASEGAPAPELRREPRRAGVDEKRLNNIYVFTLALSREKPRAEVVYYTVSRSMGA